MASGDRFLGYHGYLRRERLQRRDDHRLCRFIGRRHRRGVGLGTLGDDALVVAENDLAGPLRDRLDLGQQLFSDRHLARMCHAAEAR